MPATGARQSDVRGTPASEHVQDYDANYVRQYQAHLFTDRKLEAVSVAQQLSAQRFFFLKTLERPWICRTWPGTTN
jgi:hypothetical protein